MKYLPDLLSGKKIGAFGLTEPNAGTDASGQQTTAVLEGDHYVLNGSKCFITNGTVASTIVVFAMTDPKAGNHGISAFIVESSFPGFSVGKKEKKMGIRGSSTCDLIFEDCIVPKENLLGKEGQGFKIAMQTLDGGRIGIAAQALGLGEGAIDEAVKYTQERVQFKKRLSQFQNTQFPAGPTCTPVCRPLSTWCTPPPARRRITSPTPWTPPWPSCSPLRPLPTSPAAPCSCSAATAIPVSTPWSA